MLNKLVAKSSTTINAPANKVWQALTDPAMIKEWLFGTDTHSDWKKGSSITYTGEWEGKPYTDKGVIVDIIPDKLLHTTYLSGMSGKEDIPENYNNVIYELQEADGRTLVTITQDNIGTEKEKEHMHQNWSLVLNNMKTMLEK